jgi:predicted branched-subunit amino acid permease
MWPGAHAARHWLVSLTAAALSYLLVPGAWYVAAGSLAGVLSALMVAEQQ